MTEAEWLACRTSRTLLDFLRGDLTERKLRLIGCGCCRACRPEFKLAECGTALAVAERIADGVASQDEIAEGYRLASYARDMATGTMKGIPKRYKSPEAVGSSWAVYELVEMLERTEHFLHYLHEGVAGALRSLAAIDRRPSADRAQQTRVIRDIVGNPFRPITCDPSWRTSDVMLLAQGIYDDRAFDRMPILADALQDTGCDNDDILNHCRDTSLIHVRGCWVVDLVLGK